MRGDTVIIFARAPRLGQVKRRLAQGIGATAALRFYRGELARLCRCLGRDRRWRTVLAVTPDRAAHRGARWPGPRLPRLPQGRGDIGARMARALARHRRRAVLVGCDIPGLEPADVAAAFRALGRGAQAVFGPAEDGGFWLVGLGPRRPPRPFAAVRWSGPHALSDTLANCRGRPVALLRRLRDVDGVEDLIALGLRAGGPVTAGGRASAGTAVPPVTRAKGCPPPAIDGTGPPPQPPRG